MSATAFSPPHRQFLLVRNVVSSPHCLQLVRIWLRSQVATPHIQFLLSHSSPADVREWARHIVHNGEPLLLLSHKIPTIHSHISLACNTSSAGLLHLSNIQTHFRSSPTQQLSVARTRLILGKHAFSVPAPSISNELTTTLKLSEILSSFCKKVKVYFLSRNCVSTPNPRWFHFLVTTLVHFHFLIVVYCFGLVNC